MPDRAPRTPHGPPSREPSGQSLNRSVTQRPTRPGGGMSGASATRPRSAAVSRAVASSTSLGSAARTRGWAPPPVTATRPPNRSQLVPRMAIGTSGTPDRRAKIGGALAQRQDLDSAGVDPALAGDRDDARRSRSPHRPAGSRRAGRSWPACMGSPYPVQVITRFRPPAPMSSSFGPKNHSRGRNGRTAISTNGSAQLMWLKQ